MKPCADMDNRHHLTSAQRKQLLVQEAAAYRAGLTDATNEVKASIGAESIARSALSYLGMAAFGVIKSRTGLAGVGLQTVLPFLISGMSALSKKSLGKSALRSGVLLGAVAALVCFLVKKKKAKPDKKEGRAPAAPAE